MVENKMIMEQYNITLKKNEASVTKTIGKERLETHQWLHLNRSFHVNGANLEVKGQDRSFYLVQYGHLDNYNMALWVILLQ